MINLGTRSAILTTALALIASPTAALASDPPGKDQPGPTTTLPAKAKAYGRYCQGQSKQQVKGEKGTRFSQCVTAMAKLASGATKSPAAACSAMSKARTAGRKASPFSDCVAAGAKLLKDREQQSPSQPSPPTTTLTR